MSLDNRDEKPRFRMSASLPTVTATISSLFALAPFALVACASANHGVEQRQSLDALADCPRWPRVASADDISNMASFIDREDRALANDHARCGPAHAECLRDCESYVKRCPGPYFPEDTCFRLDPIPPADFCVRACSGIRRYLARAVAFREDSCKAPGSK